MLRVLHSIYQHLSPRRRFQFLLVLCLMMVGTVAEVFTLGAIVPFLGLLMNPSVADQQPLVAAALDTVAPVVGGSRLAAASLWFAVFAITSAALRLTLNWASFKFVFSVGADFGEAIYSRTLQQPYSYHLQRNSSETLAAVDKVGSLVMGVMAPLMQAGIAVVMVVTVFSIMVWFNPGAALGAGLLFGGLYAGISAWAKRRLRANGRLIADNGTLKIKAMQEGLGAIRDVIINGNHAVYAHQFSRADRSQRLAQARNLVLAGSPKYVVESVGMVLFVLLALVLAFGPGGVTQAIPTLGALALGAQRLLPYMQNIYNGVASSRGSLPSALETLSLLDLHLPSKPNVSNKQLRLGANLSVPAIELRHIFFAYSLGGNYVLNGVDLCIQSGDRVGFIGATGSGKSTLIDIIMGLLPPTGGQILVDGHPLTPNNLRAWQDRIAHVPQAIFLSDSSIAENIALGKPLVEIDLARLHIAIEQAQLTEVIHGLIDGIYTRVGERGIQLSGGQRQRIGIARALYKECDVLVLDEATSALDDETEKKIMDAIYQLNPEIVILMIAHRTSTLARCGVIYKLNTGSIAIEATNFSHA